MKPRISGYAPDQLAALTRVLGDPSLAREYDTKQGPGALEGWLTDPYLARETVLLAWLGDEPVGFTFSFVLKGREERWGMIRLGVVERHRRHGIGSLLLAEALQRLEPHGIHELRLSAWQPCDPARGFAARHGFAASDLLWMMERSGGPAPEPDVPPGVEFRSFDASDRAYEDAVAAYNDSFEHHPHSPLATSSELRGIFERTGHRYHSMIMAYRNGVIAGFCRCETHPTRGEIAVLGTVAAARGIGLGRALLRWGVRWLERERAPSVTLLVHGKNETALRLYRSEGFEIARTRDTWVRSPGADASRSGSRTESRR